MKREQWLEAGAIFPASRSAGRRLRHRRLDIAVNNAKSTWNCEARAAAAQNNYNLQSTVDISPSPRHNPPETADFCCGATPSQHGWTLCGALSMSIRYLSLIIYRTVLRLDIVYSCPVVSLRSANLLFLHIAGLMKRRWDLGMIACSDWYQVIRRSQSPCEFCWKLLSTIKSAKDLCVYFWCIGSIS